MIPAEICRAALCEAGRPDLARNIGTNRAGHPMRPWPAYSQPDAELVARALALSYRSPALLDWATVERLMTALEPQFPGVHHWSPRWCRWVVDFRAEEWA